MKDEKERVFRLGAEKATSSDCKNSFLFPDYAATVLFVVLGRAIRLHVTSKPQKKQRGKCCHELDEGCLAGCATRGQRRNDDVQRPSQPADLKEHVHHTS